MSSWSREFCKTQICRMWEEINVLKIVKINEKTNKRNSISIIQKSNVH